MHVYTRTIQLEGGGPSMRTRAHSVAKDDLPVSIVAVSLVSHAEH
jgi:hypothetical protein